MRRSKKPSSNDSCTWVQEQIDAYLDSELDRDAYAVLEGHVERCGACRQELAAATAVLDGLRSLPGLECPQHVVDDAFDTVRAARTGVAGGQKTGILGWLSGRQFGIPRPALAGALAMLVVISSLYVGRLNPPPQPSDDEIAEAEAELRLALDYVNEINRRTGLTVRDDVIDARVVQQVQKAVRSALVGDPPPPPKGNGGSV